MNRKTARVVIDYEIYAKHGVLRYEHQLRYREATIDQGMMPRREGTGGPVYRDSSIKFGDPKNMQLLAIAATQVNFVSNYQRRVKGFVFDGGTPLFPIELENVPLSTNRAYLTRLRPASMWLTTTRFDSSEELWTDVTSKQNNYVTIEGEPQEDVDEWEPGA